MVGDMILHVNHISGKRMIGSDIDGLSRGVTNEGVMRVVPIKDYLPIHLSAVERSSKLIPWIRSWWLQDEVLEHQLPINCYAKVFTKGFFYGHHQKLWMLH